MCADLPRLGAPTALVALEGVLCMGCQNGSVLCIPQASLRAGTTEGASELKDAGGVGRLLTSLFARWGSIAPILLRDCRHDNSTSFLLLCADLYLLSVRGPDRTNAGWVRRHHSGRKCWNVEPSCLQILICQSLLCAGCNLDGSCSHFLTASAS